MRRLALMLACGALWLILAAIPALADGGPHVMTSNNGSLGLNADGCAGCHRAHTAQGPYLINAADEEALCLTCHGSAVTGATTDVMNGIQYALAARAGGTELGALRGGGFVYARLDDATRVATSTGGGLRAEVPVGAAEVVTSAHLDLDGGGGVVATGIAWGNGANGSGAGPEVELSCASCHNPHGNGMYRILNPIPAPTGVDPFVSKTSINIVSSDDASDLITTALAHNFQVGDRVVIAGHSAALNNATGTYWVVVEVPNGITFKVASTLANPVVPFDILADTGAGGTATWFDHPVTDAPLPTPGDVRNYTVIQQVGTQGTDSSYLLYASQLAVAGSHRDVIGIASSNAATEEFTTASAHGLTVGNSVTVEFHDAVTVPAPASGVLSATVASTPTGTTFTLTGVTITTGGTAVGVLTRTYTAAFAATDGDYFHRTTPWYYTTGQADDAPNGQPASNPAAAAGDVAFNAQITAWCSSCHTRYIANQNPNPGGQPGSSSPASRSISATSSVTRRITTGTTSHGFVVGDVVAVAGNANIGADGNYTVETVPSSTTFTLVGITPVTGGAAGTVIRFSDPQAQSSWWFPRPGDSIFKYQHRTVPNRACTTCHVSHGSNVQMTGTFSSTYTRPDGTPSASSRLLKIDNRGTCQACHDPTSTIPAGSYTGLPALVP